ncbi:hypothetical protein, partial [Xanthomonas citri]|uniref:hypothetical protein n=1 Tax=Xanthomonas citri TaxID=346 RepID=UPI001F323422
MRGKRRMATALRRPSRHGERSVVRVRAPSLRVRACMSLYRVSVIGHPSPARRHSRLPCQLCR